MSVNLSIKSVPARPAGIPTGAEIVRQMRDSRNRR